MFFSNFSFSTFNEFKSSLLPKKRQWISDNLWQIFFSFIFTCGLINWKKYRYDVSILGDYVLFFLLFGIPMFIFLGYLWHILKRYLISKYAPYYMENDIIEIRLHNLTIQFRCVSRYSLQEVKNTIDIRKDHTGSIFENQVIISCIFFSK